MNVHDTIAPTPETGLRRRREYTALLQREPARGGVIAGELVLDCPDDRMRRGAQNRRRGSQARAARDGCSHCPRTALVSQAGHRPLHDPRGLTRAAQERTSPPEGLDWKTDILQQQPRPATRGSPTGHPSAPDPGPQPARHRPRGPARHAQPTQCRTQLPGTQHGKGAGVHSVDQPDNRSSPPTSTASVGKHTQRLRGLFRRAPRWVFRDAVSIPTTKPSRRPRAAMVGARLRRGIVWRGDRAARSDSASLPRRFHQLDGYGETTLCPARRFRRGRVLPRQPGVYVYIGSSGERGPGSGLLPLVWAHAQTVAGRQCRPDGRTQNSSVRSTGVPSTGAGSSAVGWIPPAATLSSVARPSGPTVPNTV